MIYGGGDAVGGAAARASGNEGAIADRGRIDVSMIATSLPGELQGTAMTGAIVNLTCGSIMNAN